MRLQNICKFQQFLISMLYSPWRKGKMLNDRVEEPTEI